MVKHGKRGKDKYWHLLEAGFPEEEVTSWSEPSKNLSEKLKYFLVGQIHQNPVAEHDINTGKRQKLFICCRSVLRDLY